jgi:hypothetical protein
MTTQGSGNITLEDFKVIVQRAGLDLTTEEMEYLLPMYQQLAGQVSMLHDPGLPLQEPAVTFPADWSR